MIEPRNEQSNPDQAATFLANGVLVDWCPGDATRYELLLVERFGGIRRLVLLNLGGHVFELPTWRPDVDWWVERGLPHGSWPGLRPLLAALGVADGPATYTPTKPYRAADGIPESWVDWSDVQVENRARRVR